MLDLTLLLRVKLPAVDGIHLQSNTFAMSDKNEATGDSKLNNSPDTVNDAVKIFENTP